MNLLRVLFVLATFNIIIDINSAFAQNTSNGNGYVVVELFTSEGCSSCPAAERVCAKLHNEFKNTCFLEFHVDYWNYLGWKDEYSDVAYTKRQQDYARFFRLSSSYTPQAIVNGSRQMVGSDNDIIRGAIQTAMNNKVAAKLDIDATIAGKFINISYNTNDLDGVLNIAIVQVNAETNVKRGENAGKKLTHNNVVRYFKVIPVIKEHGDVMMDWPAGASQDNIHVICYLQKKDSKEVVAGKEIGIR